MANGGMLLEALGGIEHAAAIAANVAHGRIRIRSGLLRLRRRQLLGRSHSTVNGY